MVPARKKERLMKQPTALATSAASALAIGIFGKVAAQPAREIVGVWEWVSVENTLPDGQTTHPFGPKPGGYLTLDAGGRFFWLITRPGRPNFARGRRDQGTAAENAAAVQGSLAYAGTYTVERGSLIMTVEAST